MMTVVRSSVYLPACLILSSWFPNSHINNSTSNEHSVMYFLVHRWHYICPRFTYDTLPGISLKLNDKIQVLKNGKFAICTFLFNCLLQSFYVPFWVLFVIKTQHWVQNLRFCYLLHSLPSILRESADSLHEDKNPLMTNKIYKEILAIW